MNLMKRLSILCCVLLLTTLAASATTLGEATSLVIERSGSLISRVQTQPSTWGTETALKDLKRLNLEARALEKALDGQDAEQLKSQQTAFSTASRRVQTSASLLPDSVRNEAEQLQQQVDAINARLTQLRLRFGSKASLAPGALSRVDLVPGEDGLAVYENPNQLLIDVRDARRLVQSFRVGRYPQFGLGFGCPNNLDPLQVRRLVLASWELERRLSGRYDDIQESLSSWQKMEREYRRLGYLPPSTAARQLDRVMKRLGAFYSSFES